MEITLEIIEVDENERPLPVTQCLLCQQEFTNPRVLSCVHTFCVQCLTKYSEEDGKQPGQHLPCPICRKEFVIPDGGIENLPKNTFMEHLLEIRSLERADSNDIVCQVCDLDETVPSHALSSNCATMYCLDCRQYHCSRCSKHHTKQRFSQGHEMVKLGQRISTEMINRVRTYCDQHRDKQVEFYCYDCRVTFCMSCYVVRHNNHRSCDIAEISAKFYRDVEEDVGRVIKITGECQKEAQYLETLQETFLGEVEAVKKRIKRDSDKLRQFLDQQESKLFDDLKEIKERNVERIKHRMHDIRQHISMVQNFKQYITEVREKATPADVSRIGGSLHDRANELHAIPYDVDFALDTISYESEDFAQNYRSTDQAKNMIGCVSVMHPSSVEDRAGTSHQNQDVNNGDEIPSSQSLLANASNAAVIEVKVEPPDADSEKPSTSRQSPLKSDKSQSLLKVVKNVFKGAEIQGITAVNGELFLVRKPESVASAVAQTVDVEVFDIATYVCSRRIPVPGLHHPEDMTSCTNFVCLYISDSVLCSIHKIQLGNSVQKKWPVVDRPGCLSVNSTLNVLVSCTQSHLVKEYRTDGTLVREIDVAKHGLTFPRHAAQLESGLLIICHGSGSHHQVCIIDIDGNIMESFGGSDATKVNQLNQPSYVTIIRGEYIFVADSGNRRILLLTSTLERGGFVLSRSEMMRNPFRMLLVNDTLYVVDNFQSEGQVLVCSYHK